MNLWCFSKYSLIHSYVHIYCAPTKLQDIFYLRLKIRATTQFLPRAVVTFVSSSKQPHLIQQLSPSSSWQGQSYQFAPSSSLAGILKLFLFLEGEEINEFSLKILIIHNFFFLLDFTFLTSVCVWVLHPVQAKTLNYVLSCFISWSAILYCLISLFIINMH